MAPDAPCLRPRQLRSCIVIPARLESTRLPRKMLLSETGKPLIQHTYEAASRAVRPREVWVAADDADVVQAVRRFGGRVALTSPALRNGTERVAEMARRISDVDVLVNVQGDEPEISPAAIDQVIGMLERDPQAALATVATPIRDRQRLLDPACVKVVFDHAGRALYFSRSPIPCARQWHDALLTSEPPLFFQHVGLYAYRRDFLRQLIDLPPAPNEEVECLEQLRFLHHGHSIAVGIVDEAAKGIDTWDDYREFVQRQGRRAA